MRVHACFVYILVCIYNIQELQNSSKMIAYPSSTNIFLTGICGVESMNKQIFLVT